MSAKDHWEAVYARRAPDQVSWFRPHLDRSLAFIERAGLTRDAAIIDVGGGPSTLVDDLLARGHTNVTVLDISATAIDTAKARLGERASLVRWVVGDVTELDLGTNSYDFWHDRAVFHFLRDQAVRRRYVATVRRTVKPGGHVLVATFGPEGPERCSDLEIVRYDADTLHEEFGTEFRKVDSLIEVHRTPRGAEQQFVYCYCRLTGDPS
jgi:SAM-dependent methyltransferase